MQFECYDCWNKFDYEQLIDPMFLICPYCGSEDVENLFRWQEDEDF